MANYSGGNLANHRPPKDMAQKQASQRLENVIDFGARAAEARRKRAAKQEAAAGLEACIRDIVSRAGYQKGRKPLARKVGFSEFVAGRLSLAPEREKAVNMLVCSCEFAKLAVSYRKIHKKNYFEAIDGLSKLMKNTDFRKTSMVPAETMEMLEKVLGNLRNRCGGVKDMDAVAITDGIRNSLTIVLKNLEPSLENILLEKSAEYHNRLAALNRMADKLGLP